MEIPKEFAEELLSIIDGYEQRPKTDQERAMIAALLAECLSLCVAKPDSDTSGQVYVNAMIRRLEAEPLDAVISALKKYPETSEWRPTWKAINELIKEENSIRNAYRVGIWYCADGFKNGIELWKK